MSVFLAVFYPFRATLRCNTRETPENWICGMEKNSDQALPGRCFFCEADFLVVSLTSVDRDRVK
jgi:hypothetical protein